MSPPPIYILFAVKLSNEFSVYPSLSLYMSTHWSVRMDCLLRQRMVLKDLPTLLSNLTLQCWIPEDPICQLPE